MKTYLVNGELIEAETPTTALTEYASQNKITLQGTPVIEDSEDFELAEWTDADGTVYEVALA